MKVTDTDSKGRIVVQNERGGYLSIPRYALDAFIKQLVEVQTGMKRGDERKRTDSRRNY